MTDAEKLIAVMLCEIHEHLNIKGEIDPKFVSESVMFNKFWAIKSKYHGIFDGDEEASDEVVEETHDILQMWSIIETLYGRFSEEDKKSIADKVESYDIPPKFEGFDGNNDKHYGIARTMINDLGYYEEFKNRELNSHTSISLHGYRSMLEKFHDITRNGNGAKLTADQVAEIMNHKRS